VRSRGLLPDISHIRAFSGTEEGVCIRKEFNSQYGRRDVKWKHSIPSLCTAAPPLKKIGKRGGEGRLYTDYLYPKGMAFALFWSEKGCWLQLPILVWNREKYRKYSCRGKLTKSNKEMLTEKMFTRLENSPSTHAITFSNGQFLNPLSYFFDDVISCILVYVISDGSRGGARGARPPPPLCLDRTEAWRAEKNFLEPGTPLSQDQDDRPPPHPIPAPDYLKVWIRHW